MMIIKLSLLLFSGGLTFEEVVRSCLLSHSSYVKLENDYVTIASVDHGDRLDQSKHIKGETIADAATHMVLVIYRNQLVHAFVPYSLLSMIVVRASKQQEVLSTGKYYVPTAFYCLLPRAQPAVMERVTTNTHLPLI